MHSFLPSGNADVPLPALLDALDRMEVGVALLDQRLRVSFFNRRQAALFALPTAALQNGPYFGDVLGEAAAAGLFGVIDDHRAAFVDGQLTRIEAGDVGPERLELMDGRRLLFTCRVCEGGGRVLTYTDISGELSREAAEAVEKAGSDLRYTNELIEGQAADLVSLAETAHENARTAEEARQQLEHEIEERGKLEDNLRRMATTDGLTGALNRAAFLTSGQQVMTQSRGRGCAVLMLDVDHFKSINDRFGHAGGDVALRHLVQTLRACTRPLDLVGRLGGEEFCILLRSVTRKLAEQIASRLLITVAEISMPHGDRLIAFTVSIGLALPRASDAGFEDVIARADAALYRAKADGRNRVVADRGGECASTAIGA